MRRAFPWLLLGAGLVTLVALVLFGAPAAPPSTHSSRSDAADGTSALYRAAAAGRSTVRLGSSPALGSGLLFIFSPNEPYSRREAAEVYDFVRHGGTLVYASEVPDPELEARFGLVRDTAAVRDVVAFTPGPLLSGVREVSGGATAYPFMAFQPDQVPIIRGALGDIVGLEQHVGSGLLVALADPLPLCNGYLLRSDNARLDADLLGTAPATGPIAFDESHHAAAAAGPAPAVASQSAASPWIYALVWAVIALYVGLALRGRAFGPPIPLSTPQARSTAEYVDAVGTLLRRSGGRRQAAELLLNATRRYLGRRLGGRSLPPDRLQELLERRRPELAGHLQAAENATAGAEGSEASLLEAARNLHDLEALR